MRFRRVTLLFAWIFLLAIGFAGCSGEQDDVGTGTANKSAKRSANSATQGGPGEAVTRMAEGLADGRPEVAWQALPPSYREDVNSLVNLAATKMDEELWNRSFGLAQKVARLAREKKDYLLEQPMLAQSGGSKSKKEMEAGFDAVAGIFETLSNSELADLKKLEKIDIEEFLAGTGSKVMQQLAAASALTPDDGWKEQMSLLRRTEATVVSESGETAVVRIEKPGAPPTEDTYVRVEGHWIPKTLADGWKDEIAEARKKIEAMSGEEMAQNKQSVLMQISMVEAALDQLLATKSRAEFDAAIAPIMGMAMGAMMAQAAGSSQGSGSPFGNSGAGKVNLPPGNVSAPSFKQAQILSPDTKPDRGLGSTTSGSHEMYSPGEVRFDQAHLYVGQFLRVHTENGLNAVCRLKEARPDVLIFERALHGGSASFQVSPDEIESLRIVEH